MMVKAEEETTATWTASNGGLGSGIGTGTIKDSEQNNWSYQRTLSSGTSYSGWTSSCIQLGKSGGVENLRLSTSAISGVIKSVSVECSSYQGKHNVAISVGGTSYLESTATPSWTTVSNKTGTGTSSGEIVITFTGGTRALYIKSFTVVYEQVEKNIEGISLGDDVSIAKGQTVELDKKVSFTPADTTQTNYTYTIDSGSEYVSIDNGVLTGIEVGQALVSVTSDANGSITDQITVTVGNKIPTAFSRTKFLPTLEDDTFDSLAANSSANKLTVAYSDSTSQTLTDFSSVKVFLDETEIAKNYRFTPSDTGKRISYQYTSTVDDNEFVLTTNPVALNINAMLSITDVVKTFAGSKNYLLVDDKTSKLTISFTSYDGEPLVGVASSNDAVLAATTGSVSYTSDTHTGSFDVTLNPKSAGVATLTISFLTENEYELDYVSDTIVVRSNDPQLSGDRFEKVTDTEDIVDGQYLIVYEGGSVAFNGSLDTLDAVENTVPISLTVNDTIETNIASLQASTFSLDATNKKITSSSGNTIGIDNDSNGLSTGDTLTHSSLAINNDGDFDAVSSGGAYLRFNSAANQLRFRYYKSTSYTNQKAIQLYKFVEGEESLDDFDVVYQFVSDFMHPEIGVSDKGSGQCLTENSGWYDTAIREIAKLTDAQRLLFKTNFTDYYVRLQNWAIANKTTFEISDVGEIVHSAYLIGSPASEGINPSPLMAIIVVTGVLATSSFLLLRRKKEDR